jgi:hypothetical protein
MVTGPLEAGHVEDLNMLHSSLPIALFSTTLAISPAPQPAPVEAAQAQQVPADPPPEQPSSEASSSVGVAPAASAASVVEAKTPTPLGSGEANVTTQLHPSPAPAEEVFPAPTPAVQVATSEPAEATKPDPKNKPLNLEKAHFKQGGGLSFESKDKESKMEIRLRVQFRDELSAVETAKTNEDGSSAGNETEVSNTFGIRRARLQFQGNIFGKNNKYKAEFAFSPSDLGLKDGSLRYTPLLSWYVEFTQLKNLSLRMGQYKLLYSRQRVISSGDLELVDRSLAQNEFNLDRDIGFHFFSRDLFGLDMLRYYAGVTLGEGRDVYAAEQFKGTDAGGLQYLARLEFLPTKDSKGKWDYSEVDLKRSSKPKISIGLSYAFLDDGTKDRGYQGSSYDAGTVDYHNAAADVLAYWAGFSGFGEFFWRKGNRQGATAADTQVARSGLGYTAQVGYLLPNRPFNIAARYSGVSAGSFKENETGISSKNELGGGVGYYFAGHAYKIQGDYFHQWGDKFGEFASNVVRVQLQFAY